MAKENKPVVTSVPQEPQVQQEEPVVQDSLSMMNGQPEVVFMREMIAAMVVVANGGSMMHVQKVVNDMHTSLRGNQAIAGKLLRLAQAAERAYQMYSEA